MDSDNKCCYLDLHTRDQCPRAAVWEAFSGSQPMNNTMGCSDHIGHLLEDDTNHMLWPVKPSSS